MADNETTAGIIAEKRRRSDEAYKGSFNYPECQENQIEYDEASEWADRLEAAHKREMSKNASKNGADFGQLGDVAKLRETISTLRTALKEIRNDVLAVADTIRGKARAALAEPPRNCDRFATAEEARQAWLDDAGNWDEFGSPKLELHEWLYAPATEKEGQENG